jgi:hypothetical protein
MSADTHELVAHDGSGGIQAPTLNFLSVTVDCEPSHTLPAPPA